MRSTNNIQDLEHMFAIDLKSPIFSQLASIYYNNYDFKKASKVCDIGLSYDPNNANGQFIKSKILLIENKPKHAEKLLKNIINLDKNNINALLTLIEVEKSLNKSQTIINKYIMQAYKLFPENKKINEMYLAIKTGERKTKGNKKVKIDNKDTININVKMATQTMYKLMMQQKKIDIAYRILQIMSKKKGSNKSFIKKELKKIKALTNKK